MKKVCMLILTLLVVIVVSCSPKVVPNNQPVHFVHYFTGSLSAGVAELSATFNSGSPDYRLSPTALDHEAFKTAIRLQLEGPNPPDIFSYWAGARTRNLVVQGLVAPIDNLYLKGIDPNTFDQSLLDSIQVDGKAYMVPLTRHYVGFFYNRKIFKDAGLSEPQTWADFEKLAKTIKDRGIIPFALGAKNRWPVQFWFDFVLARSRPLAFRELLIRGEAPYNSAETIDSLKPWLEFLEKGYFNRDSLARDWDGAMQMVLDGNAAMTLMGTWAIGYCNDQKAIYNQDYGFFAFPELDPQYSGVGLGPIDGILLSSKARSPVGAMAVLERLAKAETQASFNVPAGSVAPNRLVPAAAYPELQQRVQHLISQCDTWIFAYDLSANPAHAALGLQAFAAIIAQPGDVSVILAGLDRAILAIEP